MIFPEEFQPPNPKSWKGISLKQWMDYIFKEKPADKK